VGAFAIIKDLPEREDRLRLCGQYGSNLIPQSHGTGMGGDILRQSSRTRPPTTKKGRLETDRTGDFCHEDLPGSSPYSSALARVNA
jgi:hypothetical protein